MSETLCRVERRLTRGELLDVLAGRAAATAIAEPTPQEADLSPVDAAIQRLLRDAGESPGELPGCDSALCRPVFDSLNAVLPRSLAIDGGFWTWLAAIRYREFTWRRWNDNTVPKADELDAGLTQAMVGRFQCTGSLNAVSRHTFARVYWANAALHDGDDISLAERIFGAQDLFQAVFERRLGLHPPAARALARHGLALTSESDRRAAARRLNHSLSTIAVEMLDEKEVRDLLT